MNPTTSSRKRPDLDRWHPQAIAERAEQAATSQTAGSQAPQPEKTIDQSAPEGTTPSVARVPTVTSPTVNSPTVNSPTVNFSQRTAPRFGWWLRLWLGVKGIDQRRIGYVLGTTQRLQTALNRWLCEVEWHRQSATERAADLQEETSLIRRWQQQLQQLGDRLETLPPLHKTPDGCHATNDWVSFLAAASQQAAAEAERLQFCLAECLTDPALPIDRYSGVLQQTLDQLTEAVDQRRGLLTHRD